MIRWHTGARASGETTKPSRLQVREHMASHAKGAILDSVKSRTSAMGASV